MPIETAPPVPVVAGFQLRERLAVGGQGSIWSARRERDDRDACLKVARPMGATAIAAWRREIELQHRAADLAPEVLDHGTTSAGDEWLAMARIRGDTLAATLQAEPGPWSCGRVADVIAPVLASVAALHRLGIVHGDLKPENLFVACDRAVLVDFGSATTLDDGADTACAGTACYLAPERATASMRASAASDLYAIAVMAFELLTGVPPFCGPDEVVVEAHRSRRPPALVRWGLPAALDDVLRRTLAKDPRQRPRDADDLAAILLANLRRDPERVAVALIVRETASSTGWRRARASLVWFRSGASTAELHVAIARHRGVVAHARRGSVVAVFPPQASRSPLDAAVAAARELLALGVCDRALVDVDIVGVSSDTDPPRILLPQFAFDSRYPDANDPPGVAFTKSAAEMLDDVPVLPLAHRDDRFAIADADTCALAMARSDSTALFGRTELLATLHAAAIAAAAGRPTIATLVGEPGTGRTRIATALSDALAAEGVRVLRLAAPETGASGCIPIVLRRLLDAPAARPSDPRGWLARRLATGAAEVPIGLLLALEWTDADDPEVAAMRAAPGAIRTSVAVATAEMLLHTATSSPLAIVVDDADRAEPAWLDAVEAATLAEHGARLFVGLHARPGFASDRAAWSSRAACSLRSELPALDLAATGDLVRELLQPALNIPDDAIALMHRRTRGLPSLLVELARVLRGAGALQRVGSGYAFISDVLHRVPDLPLAEWMAQREIDRLPRALGRHAAVVAAMAPNTSPAALEATLRRLDAAQRALPTDLDPEVAAARLVAAGVLRSEGDALVFRHAALRDQAARALDHETVEQLHAAAHDVLADIAAPNRTQLAARLHHALGAGLTTMAAADALTLASDAGRRHAYLEAESCYAITLAHVEATSDAAITALHGRGLVRFRLGRYLEARTDLERVVAGAHARDDRLRLVESLLDAATIEDWCEDYDRAESLVDRACAAIVEPTDPLTSARLALARGRVAFRRGRIDDAIAALEDAVHGAGALGDDAYETHVIALLLLAPLLGMTGHADRSLPLFERLFELCRAHSDRIHLATAFLNRPFVWIELQEYGEMHADLERVISLSRAAGFPLLECRARYNLGEIAYLLGDFVAAERHADDVLDLQQQLGGDTQRVFVTQLLAARSRARRGQLREAAVLVESLRSGQAQARLAGASGCDLMASDEILCRMVELACAQADADAWAEIIAQSERDSVQQEHIEVLELAGLAAGRRGDLESARVLLQRALAATDSTPTMLRPRVLAALASLDEPGSRRTG